MLLLKALANLLATGVRRVAKNNLGLVCFAGCALDRGGVAGHDHHGADAEHLAYQRDGLPMVAGGESDDTPLFLTGVEFGNGIEGAAEFERTDPLEIFTLEKHVGASQAIHGARGQNRREMRLAAQPFASQLDLFEQLG